MLWYDRICVAALGREGVIDGDRAEKSNVMI